MQNSVVNKLADAHSQINTEKAEARHSTAEIEALCDKLRLPSFKKYYLENHQRAEFISLAQDDRIYHLLHAEVLGRKSKRCLRLRREAELPGLICAQELESRLSDLHMTRDAFDMLLSGTWCAESAVLLTGKAGTGKTDFTCGLLDGLAYAGIKVRYYSYSMLMMLLSALYVSGKAEAYAMQLEQIGKARVIAMDDLGVASQRPNEAGCMKDLLDLSINRGMGVIIASQMPPEQWYAYYGGGKTADAVMDRILRHPLQVKFNGDSKRSHGVQVIGGVDE